MMGSTGGKTSSQLQMTADASVLVINLLNPDSLVWLLQSVRRESAPMNTGRKEGWRRVRLDRGGSVGRRGPWGETWARGHDEGRL